MRTMTRTTIAPVTAAMVWLAAAGAQTTPVVSPPLPTVGQEVSIRLDGGGGPLEVRIEAAGGLVQIEGAVSAATPLTWEPTANGIYRLRATDSNGVQSILELPVLAAGRDLDFVWYQYQPWMRWATVITTAGEDELPALRARGVRAFKWRGVQERDGEPLDEAEARAAAYYRMPEGFAFDGYGIDEFGGYPQTEREAQNHAWLRGLLAARGDLPEGFYVAGWHSGGVRDEAVGLYKQAVDLLLIEAYVFHWVPGELGTEAIYEDLRSRLHAVRGADLFTRRYGSRARALIALDVTGGKQTTRPDVGEFEQVVRFLRRHCPEMRGLAFFNGSATDPDIERLAHELCYRYFVRPVVTFQEGALWLRQEGDDTEIVAAVSNIGGVDSGPVTVRISVDGTVVGERRVAAVPAGASRLDNRALLSVTWHPEDTGPHVLEALIVDAGSSTVLDPAIEARRYIGR